MKENKNDIGIKIALEKIQETEFKQKLDYEYDKIKPQKEEFPFTIAVANKFDHNLDQNVFKVEVTIMYEDEKNDTIVLESGAVFTFYIQNLKDIITVDDENGFTLKVDIIPTLQNIAIGTLRGIIHVRTQGTPLANYPLPPINTMDMAKSMQPKKKSRRKKE